MHGTRPAASRALGWLPVGLLVAGLVAPVLRVGVVVAIGVVAVVILARPGRPTGAAAAWVAALPLGVGLAVGLLPDPQVVDPGACADPLAPPVVRRVAQASIVLGVTAGLALRMGGRRSLGLVLPPDRRVTALAVACPVLVPVAIVLGPIIAEPFFGTVVLDVPSAAALVPAGIMALANATLEEVAYRGALQRWSAPALGRRGGIVAQGIVFGVAHQGPDLLGGAVLVVGGLVAAGIVAGVIADRTRSLLLPIAAHAAIDIPVALAKTCRLA